MRSALQLNTLKGVGLTPGLTPQVPTAFLISAQPYATCWIHPKEDTSRERSLSTIANWHGDARFYGIGPGLWSGDLVADCVSETGALQTVPVNEHAIAPSAEEPAAAVPGSTTIPPLTGDPLAPTQSDLLQHQLPLRPDPRDSVSYSHWLSAVSKPITLVPGKTVQDPDGKRAINIYGDYNWSGITLPKVASADVYANVQGSFTQPDVLLHGFEELDQETDYVFFWVGLDGYYGSTDVVQAGTRAKLVVGHTTGVWYAIASYLPFAEWAPDNAVFLPNVSISPGNSYFVQVWMSNSTGTSKQPGGYMWYYLAQEDDGPSVRGCIGPAGSTACNNTISMGQQFVGNTADWILENATVGLHMVRFETSGTDGAKIFGADAFRSDNNYSTLQCDGNQNYDIHNLVEYPSGYSQATADQTGATTAGGVANFHWIAY